MKRVPCAVLISCLFLVGFADKCEEQKKKMFPVCSCDDQCFTYRDCCFNVTIPDNFTNVNEDRSATCQQTYSKNYPSYWIISSCPSVGEDTLDENILIVGKDTLVYKNPEIAMCNNVAQFEPLDLFILVEEEASCEQDDLVDILSLPMINMSLALRNSKCALTWFPRETKIGNMRPRPCTNAWPYFRYNSNQFNENCTFFQEPISSNFYRDMYKNIYCMQEKIGRQSLGPISSVNEFPYSENIIDEYVITVKLPEKLNFEENRTNADMICSTNKNNNCRTTEIRHWKYTFKFTLGFFSMESFVHPQVHVNIFLLNFLKNDLGIHIYGGISMYLVAGMQNTTACSNIMVTVNLVSDDVMNFTMFNRRVLFLNQISQVNFTSVSNHSQHFVVNNHRCNRTWDVLKPMRTMRYRAYPVEKLQFEFSKYDIERLSDSHSFCSNLKVYYAESVVPNQYSEIKITDWSCSDEVSRIPLEKTDDSVRQHSEVLLIVVCVLGLVAVLVLVLGCRFFLRNQEVHNYCRRTIYDQE